MEHYAHLVMETQKEVSSLGGQIGETRAGGGDNASFTPTVQSVQPSQLCTAGVALAGPVIACKSIKSAGPVD